MSKDDEASKDGKAAEGKKSKKMLMIIITAVLLVVGGVGGFMMFGGGGGKASGAAAAKPKPVPGPVLPLDALTVNLSDGHYLKIKLSLQLTAAADPKTDGSKALDLAIQEFADRPLADLSSNDGRAKAKADLLKKLEDAYPDAVMDIYFTQFVMQ